MSWICQNGVKKYQKILEYQYLCFLKVVELAEYEKALDQVSNTVERLENDGFGKSPVYDLFVAESFKIISGINVGYADMVWPARLAMRIAQLR